MRWLGLLVPSMLALACKPGVGSSCVRGEARCQDRQTQLICSQGQMIASPCRGANGCRLSAAGVACDISLNRAGDPCSQDDEGVAICPDPKQILTCSGGKYQLAACRGPAGCATSGGRASCDTTLATEGDACKGATKGCSADGRQVLICQSGKMAPAFFCLGQGGCKSKAGKLDCDLTVARDEDPCTQEMQGKVACNIDKRSIVACKAGKFVIDTRCGAGKECSTEGGSIACVKPEKS